MSSTLRVENLTKVYGQQKAIDSISFQTKKGEIVGFLGPNGAGKTTTMKILTCFIPQTEGNASVCGFDVVNSPLEVRRKIGYLPEHNPLYKDMYVKEYLNFVADTYDIRNKKARIGEMIELVGLEREQNKPIQALSKGYRQRVGLAQAMIHDPEVLILDEPTSGLDPNQLSEIRQVIKTLGQDKTVVFSTHIMQEVQALCDRVLIINKGKIVADDPIEALQQRISGEYVVTCSFLESTSPAQLEKIKNVLSVKKLEKNTWQLNSALENDIRPDVFKFAVQNHLTLIEMHKATFSVEDIFQELTK